MFDPTRDQARGYFFDAWRKYREGRPLAGIEATILEVILLHPEYHALHEAIECLAETVWRSQKDKTPPDAGFYLDCLEKRSR